MVIAMAQSPAPVFAQTLSFVGSATDSPAYEALEVPFASRVLTEKSAGALKLDLRPASAAELNGRELFDRVASGKLGLAALSATQLPASDAWFDWAELTGLAVDAPSARAIGPIYRDRVQTILKDKYGLRLLGLAGVQAQTLYCRTSLARLADLKGRKVRVSGGLQAGLVEALGGQAVRMAALEVRAALLAKTIDCAIGGTMSGNQSRWHEVSTHLFSLPLGWNLNHYVIAEKTWAGLDSATRQLLQTEFRSYESRVWDSALVYTREGINCNAGVEPCRGGQRGKMNIVIGGDADRALLAKQMNDTVLPAWAGRCGAGCSALFNAELGKRAGLKPIK